MRILSKVGAACVDALRAMGEFLAAAVPDLSITPQTPNDGFAETLPFLREPPDSSKK